MSYEDIEKIVHLYIPSKEENKENDTNILLNKEKHHVGTQFVFANPQFWKKHLQSIYEYFKNNNGNFSFSVQMSEKEKIFLILLGQLYDESNQSSEIFNSMLLKKERKGKKIELSRKKTQHESLLLILKVFSYLSSNKGIFEKVKIKINDVQNEIIFCLSNLAHLTVIEDGLNLDDEKAEKGEKEILFRTDLIEETEINEIQEMIWKQEIFSLKCMYNILSIYKELKNDNESLIDLFDFSNMNRNNSKFTIKQMILSICLNETKNKFLFEEEEEKVEEEDKNKEKDKNKSKDEKNQKNKMKKLIFKRMLNIFKILSVLTHNDETASSFIFYTIYPKLWECSIIPILLNRNQNPIFQKIFFQAFNLLYNLIINLQKSDFAGLLQNREFPKVFEFFLFNLEFKKDEKIISMAIEMLHKISKMNSNSSNEFIKKIFRIEDEKEGSEINIFFAQDKLVRWLNFSKFLSYLTQFIKSNKHKFSIFSIEILIQIIKMNKVFREKVKEWISMKTTDFEKSKSTISDELKNMFKYSSLKDIMLNKDQITKESKRLFLALDNKTQQVDENEEACKLQ